MEEAEVVEHFFGVYLLYCMNPTYKGRTYIGYTVDPKRRIKQHNAGKKFGGAWRTSNRGPWNMVLIVHGFPNSTSALRFEWAWQHPHLSRRLKHVPKQKRARETILQYRLSVLSKMLKVGPWNRLPLTLRWLDYEFSIDRSNYVSPPLHMPISYGKVVSRKFKNRKNCNAAKQDNEELPKDTIIFCSLCDSFLEPQDKLTCIKFDCPLTVHLICLAKNFTRDKMLLPIEGNCPICKTNILWGDLIRKKIGCNLHLKNVDAAEDESDNDSNQFSD